MSKKNSKSKKGDIEKRYFYSHELNLEKKELITTHYEYTHEYRGWFRGWVSKPRVISHIEVFSLETVSVTFNEGWE